MIFKSTAHPDLSLRWFRLETGKEADAKFEVD
jgi:hypothetical protein